MLTSLHYLIRRTYISRPFAHGDYKELTVHFTWDERESTNEHAISSTTELHNQLGSTNRHSSLNDPTTSSVKTFFHTHHDRQQVLIPLGSMNRILNRQGRANESESGAALDGTRLHRLNLSLREIVTRLGDEDTPTRLYWRRILEVSGRDFFLFKHSVFQATARVIRDVAEPALSGTRRTTS